MDAVSRKGWTPATLQAMGVERDPDGRWVFHTRGGDLRYADDGRTPKMLAGNGTQRELWPDPEDVAGDVLMVVEGEPDAVSATELGYAAVALPGAGKQSKDWPHRLAAGRRRVVFVADADSVGRVRMRRMATQVASHGAEAVVVDLSPDRDDGYDLGDLLMAVGATVAREQVDDALFFAQPVEPEERPPERPAKGADSREIVWTTLDTIVPRKVQWLWYPYLPLGKVVLVAGAPGHGKSQLTAWLASQVTRATFVPSDVEKPGRAVIVSAEDDLSDTVVPRLLAVNADVRLVEAVSARRAFGAGHVVDGMVTLPGDVDALHDRLSKGDVRLLVFDPVASFIGRTHSTLNNQDVRDVLDPLKWMAEKYMTTIVAILHLNKSNEVREWSARIAESHGFQAVARTVLALGPDPDDDEGDAGVRKVLALPKSNLVRKAGKSMRLEIESVTFPGPDDVPIETSRVRMVGLCDIAADDLLMGREQREGFVAAREFIVDYLGEGWRKVGDLKRDATAEGHSWRTVERVRRETCKTAKEAGAQHGAWWVALKETRTPLSEHSMGGLDGVGGDKGVKDANTAHTPSRNGRSWKSTTPTPPNVTAISDFRQWEQRRLGEREDDEPS